MQVLGPNELKINVRDKALCTVCGACVGLCPYHKVHKGKVAMVFDCDLEQGQCYAACPQVGSDPEALSQIMFGHPFNDSPLGQYRKIAAAKAGKRVKTAAFQNGGTVSALMMAALDNHLIESAILTGKQEIIPTPKCIRDSKDVLSCSGTRYMATPTLSALNQEIQKGKMRHGVVGTGCQMKAVAAMKQNTLGKEEYKEAIALSLGLFCTWSLDTRKFMDFLKTKTDPKKIFSMDVPPPPAKLFIIRTRDGDLEIPLNDIRPMIPKGCSLCQDMTAKWADVSVGAFEGRPDWNTLIIRSKKGEDWVDMAVSQNYLVLENLPLKNLDQLTMGAENKRTRAIKNRAKEEK